MSLSNESILKSISADRALGSAMLFGHRHKQASPRFHITVMDLWRSADEFMAIEAFRQGAKTTLSEEFLLMEAAFKNFRYCLIFGETYTKACERIAGMKHECLTNMRLAALFGPLKGKTWSENRIELSNGVLIEAHGWEEEIRGYLHHDARPDRAYLDDIENKERVRDTATVDENWKKLYLQLIPALDKDTRKIRMTGTPLADDCMIRRAAASANWTSARFPICNGDIDDPAAQSLWAERYPMEWIRAERDKFAEQGMLREFNQEYMLVATGSQGKPFTEDMLRSADVAPITYSPRVTIIDPARTVEVKKSDQTGEVTVSKMGTRIYVHESGAHYWQPDEIVAGAFSMSAKHDSRVVIEKNSLDDWLLQPIRAMQLITGQHIDITGINAPQDRDKAQFIMGLRSFFLAGDIILVGGRAAHPTLVSQLLNFPSGKRDALNALAYALRVFSGVPIYPDFGEANIIPGPVTIGRNDALLLGCNSTGTETTAVLCAYTGSYLTVLADFVSPLVPADSIPDICKLVRSVYPSRVIAAWVPADVFDQVGRNPLVSALKSAGLVAKRADAAVMSRSSLSPMIRTEMRGRRLFQVDSNARHTMQALAQGYNWPVKPGGERGAEPERGPARTLIEGLECLTYAINKPDNAASIKSNAINSLGTSYLSALPNRR